MGNKLSDMSLMDLIDITISKMILQNINMSRVGNSGCRLQDREVLPAILLAQHPKPHLLKSLLLPLPLLLHGLGQEAEGLSFL